MDEMDGRKGEGFQGLKYDAAFLSFFISSFLSPNAIFHFLLIACLQSRECDDARHSDGGQK